MGCGSSTQSKYDSSQAPPSDKKDVITVRSCPGKDATTEPEECDAEYEYVSEANAYELTLEFLGKVPVLQSLRKADLPLIAKAMEMATYKSAEAIITQGSVGNKLFIILSGKAEVVLDQGSSEVKLATLAAGDYFGEQELLHEEVARATVRVANNEGLLAYCISHDNFWQLGLHKKLHLPKRHAVAQLHTVSKDMSAKYRASTSSKEPPKRQEDLTFLAASLRANAYLPTFCELTDELVYELASVASFRKVDLGEVVMTQGDLHGCCLYIVKSGAFEIHGHGRNHAVSELSGTWQSRAEVGDSFGELELLYSVPCAATVTAVLPSTLWAISRYDFSGALDHALAARLDHYTELLRGVTMFKALYHEELRALAATLTEVSYKSGEDIITQGEVEDTCFVLFQGEVVVLKDDVEVERRLAVHAKGKAELFGETELLKPSPRIATVRVISETACTLAIDKISFEHVLQPLDEVLSSAKKHGNNRASVVKTDEQYFRQVQRCSLATVVSIVSHDDHDVERSDLSILGNLGRGSFASVELMKNQVSGKLYALKRVNRNKIEGQYEQRQILAEKSILSMTHSAFVVHLYGTYRDEKALSFLLELVPGGDLGRALCIYDLYGNFKSAQFYTAGMVLALEHLHERCILHRDVKPDNVLLNAQGWPKVTDFGLAKFCAGHSFTLCGTPGYVAPEVISKVGHGSACDWWSLGVLMYEMMAGKTPFESPDGDFLKTCQCSMKGIPKPEGWPWLRCFGPDMPGLISSLLQPNPLKRLPMKPGGISQFKAHATFDATKKRKQFDWTQFERRMWEPPFTPEELIVEDLEPSKCEKEWLNPGTWPDTEWDAEF